MKTAMTCRASVLSLALLITACVAAVDEFAETPAGYVPDIEDRVTAIDWRQAEIVTVLLKEYAFSTVPLRFATGKPYRLILNNEGETTHFFVSEEFFRAIAARRLETSEGVVAAPRLASIVVRPGSTKVLEFVPVESGKYQLECTAPLHAVFGMVGTIEVR